MYYLLKHNTCDKQEETACKVLLCFPEVTNLDNLKSNCKKPKKRQVKI